MICSEEAVRCTIRPMEIKDIPQVVEIEKESFPAPWSISYFRKELISNRLAHYFVSRQDKDGSNLPVSKLERLLSQAKLVFNGKLTNSDYIVGFIGLWIVVDEVHITTITVKKDCRRQGIGELLLTTAIELSIEQNTHFITLEVRTSNAAARKLYEKFGFVTTGIRRNYYTDTQEDALIMTTDRLTSTSFQGNFQQLKRTHAEKWGCDS